MAELPQVDTTTVYTEEQIAKHNTEEDCWIVVNGKVYDVTTFLEDHPGGIESITAVAGTDSTDDFEAVAHSKPAIEMMAKYQVGVAEAKAGSEKTTKKVEQKTGGAPFGVLLKAGLVLAVVGAYFYAQKSKIA
uniref:Cytochrome b5 heme-binding domain-containing protein n=1 Tax=Eutreptiella gymnastica TaxID=73025 RepID=A0A6U7XZC0_9EUGL